MKRWIKITLLALLLLLGSAAGYGYYLYHSVQATVEQMYEPLPPAEQPSLTTSVPLPENENSAAAPRLPKQTNNQPAAPGQSKPFTVLIMGVDERSDDSGRSDTLILMTINPLQNKILFFNIPRDTRTEIVGHGTTDKINHAYAFGGAIMAIRTVEAFLKVPVDYYVKINMDGFTKAIDALGGVEIENQHAFEFEEHSFPKGTLHLNGEDALAFSRMRHEDPRGDLGRNERQRQILKAMLQKGSSPSVLLSFQSLLKTVGNHVKTNMKFAEIKDLAEKYQSAAWSMDSLEVKGGGKMIDGIYYYMVSETERMRLHTEVSENLKR